MVELLAPCRNISTMNAAINSGANAVYFGVNKLNMRMNAGSFQLKDLKQAVNHAHSRGVKCYLTLNSIIYEDELEESEEVIKEAKRAGVDAVIIQDVGLIPLLKENGLEFHISTQLSVSNSKSVNFYEKLGASRVILARECSLEQVKEIIKKTSIGVELFIHGAMCVSVSGRCFFSHSLHGKSANRGECMQPCRREWSVKNEFGELIYDGKRFLNAKDLCTLPFLDELINLGAVSFKIEGRMKSADYINTVVKVYREALDDFKESKISDWMKRLKSVYNRGFSTGFYYNKPNINDVELIHKGNKAEHGRVNLGRVVNYYQKLGVAELELLHSDLEIGDVIIVEGSTTFLKQEVKSIQIEHESVKKANKSSKIAVKVNKKVRENDLVYKKKV